MLKDEYLLEVIAHAQEVPTVEQRAIRHLYEHGDMANLDCDGQREVEARVRELLLHTT